MNEREMQLDSRNKALKAENGKLRAVLAEMAEKVGPSDYPTRHDYMAVLDELRELGVEVDA